MGNDQFLWLVCLPAGSFCLFYNMQFVFICLFVVTSLSNAFFFKFSVELVFAFWLIYLSVINVVGITCSFPVQLSLSFFILFPMLLFLSFVVVVVDACSFHAFLSVCSISSRIGCIQYHIHNEKSSTIGLFSSRCYSPESVSILAIHRIDNGL